MEIKAFHKSMSICLGFFNVEKLEYFFNLVVVKPLNHVETFGFDNVVVVHFIWTFTIY